MVQTHPHRRDARDDLPLRRKPRWQHQPAARNSTRTITEVAARWGFLHMGRFTRAYRDLFGELPSTTLARSLSN
ncbi:helix-turn-helix domain-containing protein [Thiorhodovibrio frisius]|uniref:helix-turn-helix domain-containing protein n=1 Tax=Thiorhodovibrio frisius TaxID=631362 RepID=UPI00022C769F|nr:helix-turn-helix domain-containing protein [Thiorhodovibrio frisius]WPL20834.1 transcriptional regulator EutR [Thiorhodovibrio frisius]